ncbi:MAG: hypothetical protein N3E36_07225 [Sulfolobales archaeon]|nr:hypothetical protein [Ignisphaera sp.]MCX8199782.1 hypothetical protein [Sulfolobales archaeon]MDW8084979.1 hypothetical protein [Ignisphaera sp.]
MPIIYKCSKCNSIVYAFIRAGQDYYGVPSPSELIVRVGGICPNCGRNIESKIDLNSIIIALFK